MVLRRAPDQAEESTKQQKLAELAEVELVAKGHHWDVPERFRSRVVSSYWKSTVDQWKQATGSGLTPTTMKVLKVSAGSPFTAMHEVYDSSTKEVVTGAAILETIPRVCATKYPTAKRDISRSWVASVVQT